MGIIRKTMSVSSLGLVDFRSDKERTAAYTKAAKKEAKAQTALMRKQAQAPVAAPPPPSGPPAGWYADPNGDASVQRWWDGTRYTEHTQPAGS